LNLELDFNDDFLTVQSFKHSSRLEYVFAAFPTIIIIYILVPSLFLLYSLDEDLDPKMTIKVVGHQ
jgi:heme/copper-type cytochrome/quinol oxidase subunit 2